MVDMPGRLSPRVDAAARLMNQVDEIGGPRGREGRHNVSNAIARLDEERSIRALEGGRGLSA